MSARFVRRSPTVDDAGRRARHVACSSPRVLVVVALLGGVGGRSPRRTSAGRGGRGPRCARRCTSGPALGGRRVRGRHAGSSARTAPPCARCEVVDGDVRLTASARPRAPWSRWLSPAARRRGRAHRLRPRRPPMTSGRLPRPLTVCSGVRMASTSDLVGLDPGTRPHHAPGDRPLDHGVVGHDARAAATRAGWPAGSRPAVPQSIDVPRASTSSSVPSAYAGSHTRR